MNVKAPSGKKHSDIRAVYSFYDIDCGMYSWMTYASALSLKQIHPEIEIFCFLTGETYKLLKKNSHPLLREVHTEVVAPPPLKCKKLISRYLKIVSGSLAGKSFIYLDSDTLVARPIETAPPGFDIAATPDKYAGDTSGNIPEWVKPYYSELDWLIKGDKYYNSGVVMYDLRVAASGFFEIWIENWKKTCGFGLHHDQPSFNYTISSLGMRVKDAGDEFNAMVQVDDQYLKDAIVMHFYDSVETGHRSKYKDLVDDLANGRITSGSEICKRAAKWKEIYYIPTKKNLLMNRRYHEILTKVMIRMRIRQ